MNIFSRDPFFYREKSFVLSFRHPIRKENITENPVFGTRDNEFIFHPAKMLKAGEI
jgi:hypothetical protein